MLEYTKENQQREKAYGAKSRGGHKLPESSPSGITQDALDSPSNSDLDNTQEVSVYQGSSLETQHLELSLEAGHIALLRKCQCPEESRCSIRTMSFVQAV